MIKNVRVGIVVIAGLWIVIASCGKHMYAMKGKEIQGYATKAKEPGIQSFVEYNNGDTIKGATLKKRHNKLSGKTTWTLDDKEIKLDNIRSYQDKYGYRMGSYSRLIRGKLSLYMSQVDNSRLATSYSSSSQSFNSGMQGGTTTSFYMSDGGPIQVITLNSLRAALKDCPTALKQVDKEFRNTFWYKRPSVAINDYRALVRIININNNCR